METTAQLGRYDRTEGGISIDEALYGMTQGDADRWPVDAAEVEALCRAIHESWPWSHEATERAIAEGPHDDPAIGRCQHSLED